MKTIARLPVQASAVLGHMGARIREKSNLEFLPEQKIFAQNATKVIIWQK